jgi:hypothetical protein
LTPLATGSLERSLLVFSTPGGLTGDDLSRLFFTCTNTSQAATYTCNTLLVRFLDVVVAFIDFFLALLVVRRSWLGNILECSPDLVALIGGVIPI